MLKNLFFFVGYASVELNIRLIKKAFQSQTFKLKYNSQYTTLALAWLVFTALVDLEPIRAGSINSPW
jgi:hypothetical protein